MKYLLKFKLFIFSFKEILIFLYYYLILQLVLGSGIQFSQNTSSTYLGTLITQEAITPTPRVTVSHLLFLLNCNSNYLHLSPDHRAYAITSHDYTSSRPGWNDAG